VQCAVEAQAALAEANSGVPPDKRINFRIGIHIGDVMVRAGDLFGDGVNIAARLQTLAMPGGVCISGATYDQVRKVLPMTIVDLGVQRVKNLQEPVRAYQVNAPGEAREAAPARVAETESPLPLPDKPSIAVLPFENMSGDPEQEYFADGMVEEITTALSRFKWLFVIARNSSFTFKGRAVDVKEVGRRLGVRYVLEGAVRKASGKVRISGPGQHLSRGALERPVGDSWHPKGALLCLARLGDIDPPNVRRASCFKQKLQWRRGGDRRTSRRMIFFSASCRIFI
jgi:adenylate cyclase